MADWSVVLSHDLSAIRSTWVSLYESTPNFNPHMAWNFVAAWHHHLGKGWQPYLLTVYQSDQPIALLPLMRRGSQLSWLAAPRLDWATLLCPDSEHLPGIVRVFADYLRRTRWSMLDLHHLYPQTAELFTNALSEVWQHTEKRTELPYVAIRGRTWDEYLNSASAATRRQLRKPGNRLERDQLSARVETLTDPEQVAAALPILDHLNAQRSAVRSGALTGSKNDFLHQVYQDYAAQGRLCVYILYYNDTPAAHWTVFTAKGATFLWQTAFDSVFKFYSPGKMLLSSVLQASFERGDSVINFMQGMEQYKYRWVEDHAQPLARPVFYRSALQGKIAAWRREQRARLARSEWLHQLWVRLSHHLPTGV